MRVNSCRQCGSEPIVKKHCNACNQPTQFECPNCKKITDDPIHFLCMFENSNASLTS